MSRMFTNKLKSTFSSAGVIELSGRGRKKIYTDFIGESGEG